MSAGALFQVQPCEAPAATVPVNWASHYDLVTGRPVTAREADAMWAVLDVSVYRLLTDLRGWSDDQYEEWVAEAIDRLLDDDRRG